MTFLVRLCLVGLILFGITSAEQMLAFAPVTALARWDGLMPRQLSADCPASTQTLCADKLGCCPNGAACTYSRNIPVCDQSCNGGPTCSRGGCCQTGYVCGITNDFCTPAPTAPPMTTDHSKLDAVAGAVEASTTTHASAPVTSHDAAPTKPAVPPASDPTSTEAVGKSGLATSATTTTTSKASMPHRASSSRVAAATTASATGKAITTVANGGTQHVAEVTSSNTKSNRPSQTATSEAVSTRLGLAILIALGGWIALLFAERF